MKTYTKNLFRLPALIAGLGLIPVDRVTAQTFTTLHKFTSVSGPSATNSDGFDPVAGLILSGNTLYGTASRGGSSGYGTVFKINTDGTGFTTLHSFTGFPNGTNSDGAYPVAELILSDDTLYWTANRGGSSGNGTVFRVNTDGAGFTNLHSFAYDSDGSEPVGGLLLSANTLYGTAVFGGSGAGTVFAVNTDGTGFTNLHSFTGGSDGGSPAAGLISSGNTLYGTAGRGGNSGYGTVFAVNTNGTDFTNLYSFTVGSGNIFSSYTNSDGVNPRGLILLGNTLYGTASAGGSSGAGTVFAVNTGGTGFTNLHSFTGGSDGAKPYAGLILSGNALYGTAGGTVFAINTDGTGLTTLHSFNNDGGTPTARLILSGNTLYGTTRDEGSSMGGTVFSLSFAPQLAISLSGANVVLTWPTHVAGFDYTGFTLQFTTNLVSPAFWCPVSPAPLVINGQNTVTNRISGTQQYYRLSQLIIVGE